MTVWLTREMLLAVHDEQIAEHGGAPDIQDMSLLESALASQLNRAAWSEADLAELGAIYGLAIARNHSFIDGNQRTAFVVVEMFLVLNGLELNVSDAEATVMMLDMAAGTVGDDTSIDWVRGAAAAQ